MRTSKHWMALACLAAMGLSHPATAQSGTSEQDFLNDVPIVLSVSRLAQRIDETPGAVTILDRQWLRRSGARDLVDVLRLVPGMQAQSSFETDAPLAAYHGISDDWSNRIQVLVDGRAVYSSHLYGSAGMGLQTLAIEDIERVEVLRGSNSATYGARAFLGVINIVSRDPRESDGVRVHARGGENGIRDAGMTIGWSMQDTHVRLGADTRSDEGLRGAFGANRIQRVTGAGFMRLDNRTELEVRAGMLDIKAGRGSLKEGEYGNPARMRGMQSDFLQLDWRRALTPDRDLLISASHTQHTFRDAFSYLDPDLGDYFGIQIDFNGQEYLDALTLQLTERVSPQLRFVSGVEFRNEKVVSPSSFDDVKQRETGFTRLFGNLEWRPHPQWVLNAGLMQENSTISGNLTAPRVMLNWHVQEGQTLRAGISTSYRPPSPYEKFAMVNYYDRNGANPLNYGMHSGRVGPERVDARELGYHFQWPSWRVTGDVRLFDENVTEGIRVVGAPQFGERVDAYNGDNYLVRGVEWQMEWSAPAGSRVIWSQTWANIMAHRMADPDMRFRTEHSVPRYAATLAWMQPLPGGFDLGVMYSRADDVALASISTRPWMFNLERLDLRLARAFQIGRSKAELSLTAQGLGGSTREADWQYWRDPRAFLSLEIRH